MKLLSTLLFMVLSLPCVAQGPVVTLSSSAVVGPAPLQVTLTAQCDTCVKYSFKPGDGGLIPGQAANSTALYIYSKIGKWTASVTGTDAAGLSATASLSISVPLVPLGENDYCSTDSVWLGAQQDEGANLPKACMYTGLDGTPSPGSKIVVTVADITALNFAASQASCGDTIIIPPQMDVVVSTWTLPNKPCDEQHWIVIRSGALDNVLPAEHARLTPCYAGRASIPNLPAYPCPTPVRVIPRLSGKTNAPPIAFAAGANHYRFMFMEITRQEGIKNSYGLSAPAMVCPRSGQPWITFNQCWQRWSVANNVIIGYAAPVASKNFGFFPGNYLTTDPIGTAASVQFVNFNNGNGGDYHLQPTSPYHNVATDGTDEGANIDAINAAAKVAQ